MVKKPIRVYVDSGVIISSLISTTGAAYMLLHSSEEIELYISNLSVEELEQVVNRLGLDSEKLHKTISTRLTSVEISRLKAQDQLNTYVRDAGDAHIVASAKEAKAAFLISYNIRHFDSEKLRQDFQIILLTPGLFLQYLRSLPHG